MHKGRRPLQRATLNDALSVLWPAERQVLLLSASEDLNNEEVAARLGITPRRARRLLARALIKLDRVLARQEQGCGKP